MLIPVRTGPAVSADEPRSRTQAIPPELVLLGLMTVVGAAIRFATISSQSYWVDESTTVHDISFGLGGLLHQVHVNETTPPLYFIVAWLWAKLFGTGEAGLRSLSALCGVATIPVAYLCGRELVVACGGPRSRRCSWRVSPFMVWYSQEARAYALFILLCGLSFLYWARAYKRRQTRELVLWAVVSALAVLTHFFAGFLIAPEAILLLYRLRDRATVVACAGGGSRAGGGTADGAQRHQPPARVDSDVSAVGADQAGPGRFRAEQPLPQLARHPWAARRRHRRGRRGRAAPHRQPLGPRRRRRSRRRSPAVVVIVPLVLAWAGRDYYVSRNLSPAWIPLAVVIGAACTAARDRIARVAGAVLAAALVVAFVYAGIRIDHSPQYQRPDWRGVAHALGPRGLGTRAIVADDGLFAAQPLWVYLPGAPWLPNEQTRSAVTVHEVDIVGGVWQTIAGTAARRGPAHRPHAGRGAARRAVRDHAGLAPHAGRDRRPGRWAAHPCGGLACCPDPVCVTFSARCEPGPHFDAPCRLPRWRSCCSARRRPRRTSPVIADCNAHSQLTQHYTVAQLRTALNTMPPTVKEYTNCYDVINRALLAQVGSGSGGGSAGKGSGGSFLPVWLIVVLVLLIVGGGAYAFLAYRRQAGVGSDGGSAAT